MDICLVILLKSVRVDVHDINTMFKSKGHSITTIVVYTDLVFIHNTDLVFIHNIAHGSQWWWTPILNSSSVSSNYGHRFRLKELYIHKPSKVPVAN